MNQALAKILYELSVLYSMKNVPYKPRALERAADAIGGLTQDVREIYREGGLQALEDIPGVGPGIAARIEEYIKTKKIAEYTRLKKVFPVDIQGIMAVEGIGPKTLATLYKKFHIRTKAQLAKAARQGKLPLKIAQSLAYLEKDSGRKIPSHIWPLVRTIVDRLSALPGVKDVEPVGSLRRMQETVGDLDFLAIANDPDRVLTEFVGLPQVESVHSHGSHKALVRLAIGIDADLWVLPAESWGAALIAWTGNKPHNIHLRTIAKKKGYMLDDYGLFRGEKMIAGRTEKEVYEKLGLQFIPPELRSDAGEIEAAAKKEIPTLIGYNDVRGDLQVQTDWTDGEHSILEMARAAHTAGLEYIAITDHTKSLTIAKGLDEKRIRKQWAEIDRVQKLVPQLKILKGSECDIKKDGSLDLDDRTLAELDVVGVSVHSHFTLSESEQTARMIRAMENNHADIVFHPTGRKIGRRAPYALDMKALIAAAKRTKTILEIDAHSDRLDLKDEYIKMAIEAGAKLSIDTDAHTVNDFQFLRWGIGQARRGWATKSDIVNTRGWRDMLKLLK